jgi:nucleotide-binding universal stress UspA family protein
MISGSCRAADCKQRARIVGPGTRRAPFKGMAHTREQAKPYIIVAGVDYSETGDRALESAFELASLQPNAEVHVVNVASAYGPMVTVEIGTDVKTLSLQEASTELNTHVEKKLREFAGQRDANAPTFARACTHVRLDSPAEGIAQLASDLEADLVIVGTHGRRGVRRVLLGSVAEGVVRLSPCQVLVVRPKLPPAAVPQIEPPCPDCVATRRETAGKELWCTRHHQRHDSPHTYHYVPRNVRSEPNFPMVTPMTR